MTFLLRPRSPDAISGAALPLQLTALVLLVDYLPGWYLRVTVLPVAAIALLFPTILRTPAVWLALSLLTAVRVIRFWPLEDNHHYLLAYWVLSIFLALCLAHPARSLAVSGRWLLGFVFLWATLWKGILSPDFVDGRFYEVALLSDPRFAELTELLTGLSSEVLSESRAYLEPTPATANTPVPRPDSMITPALSRLATFFTWSTLLVEGLLALAFLLPWGRWSQHLRHVLLLGFCIVTYTIAPVLGFGWILATIGIAQVPPSWTWWRRAYLVVFFLILFVRDVPWARFVLALKAALIA